MIKKDDWRLISQEKYLLKKELLHVPWQQFRKDWDHDHCEFCTNTFSLKDGDFNIGL
ncbi:MAG: hypothetical protein LBK08_12980 [Treponema sp.]|nr:hypothetical protein [Treponema sp.]